MENLLSIYHLPSDRKRPVVCFDELPIQLLGEIAAPLSMKKNQPQRIDYEYKRAGTAVLLVAFEPLTGKRIIEVSPRRTKTDYCRFMQRISQEFPAAAKTVLVQDNLKRA